MSELSFAEYQAKALRTASRFKTTEEKLKCAALGLNGEAGEFADIVKKVYYQGHLSSPDELAKELGDVLWYISLASDVIGVPIEQIARMNLKKLEERYPDGFSEHRSVNRKT